MSEYVWYSPKLDKLIICKRAENETVGSILINFHYMLPIFPPTFIYIGEL